MYKLEFTLKQHTPLIHFQHDQAGATLRATEVKPKLDSYLDYFVFNFEYERIKTFLVGFTEIRNQDFMKSYRRGYRALDYKIKIRTDLSRITITSIPDGFPCYFGGMGEENQLAPKKFSYTEDDIFISFQSNHKYLIDEIQKEIPNFFARNNFGTRQSKGFGSFYISEGDSKYEAPVLQTFFTIQQRNPLAIFSSIDLLHKTLRSGFNEIGRNDSHLFYMKPLIWHYFKNQNITWEKKAIKQEFYPTYDSKCKINYEDQVELESRNEWPLWFESDEKKIVKDLLGLSLLETWYRPYNISVTKKSNQNIDRLKSPILYKPIRIEGQMRIYVDSESIPEAFFDAEFLISNGERNFLLKTPKRDNFDIEDFMQWAFLEVEIESFIPEQFRDTPKALSITRMYEDLKRNY